MLDTTGLESQLANEYGVEIDDISMDTTYIVAGTIHIDLPDDVIDDELETILEDVIADALGLHSSIVEVNFDPSTREVTYTIVNDDVNTASVIQDVLESSSFLDDVNDEISKALPSAGVSDVTTNDEIEMQVVVTIDASESDADVDDTNARIVEDLENEGISANTETTFITAKPALAPVEPSISPTIDGNLFVLKKCLFLILDYAIFYVRFPERPCETLCAHYSNVMECLVHFAEDWTDIIHDEGYTDCVQGGLCGSVVLSIAGPRAQGELAVAYVKSRCFDLPRFGRFCPPCKK